MYIYSHALYYSLLLLVAPLAKAIVEVACINRDTDILVLHVKEIFYTTISYTILPQKVWKVVLFRL